jgi:hypothetical protein
MCYNNKFVAGIRKWPGSKKGKWSVGKKSQKDIREETECNSGE